MVAVAAALRGLAALRRLSLRRARLGQDSQGGFSPTVTVSGGGSEGPFRWRGRAGCAAERPGGEEGGEGEEEGV